MKLHLSLAAAACIYGQALAFDISPQNGRRQFLSTGFTAASVAAASVLTPSKSLAVDVGGKIKFGDESIMSQKVRKAFAKKAREAGPNFDSPF